MTPLITLFFVLQYNFSFIRRSIFGMRDVKQRNNFIYFCPWIFVISHHNSTVLKNRTANTLAHGLSNCVCVRRMTMTMSTSSPQADISLSPIRRCSGILILIRLLFVCCYYIFSHSIVCATLLITAVLNFYVCRFETRCVLLLLLCLSKHTIREHTRTPHFVCVRAMVWVPFGALRQYFAVHQQLLFQFFDRCECSEWRKMIITMWNGMNMNSNKKECRIWSVTCEQVYLYQIQPNLVLLRAHTICCEHRNRAKCIRPHRTAPFRRWCVYNFNGRSNQKRCVCYVMG